MFLIFVVFPASWTAIAPLSRIKLERSNQSTTATVSQCMFFVVPYYTQHLTNVSEVSVETFEGEKQGFNANLSEAENRLHRRGDSEDNSELVLSNAEGDEVRAPIDLKSRDAVQSGIEDFIDREEAAQYSVNIPANRTLFLLSFPIAMLTVLYGMTQAHALARFILGNPYWPLSADLANQAIEIARAQRDALNKA